MTNLDEIRALPLFSSTQGEHFDLIMNAAYVQNFPPQIDWINEGAPADFLHIVISGSIEHYASWNGKETILAAKITRRRQYGTEEQRSEVTLYPRLIWVPCMLLV